MAIAFNFNEEKDLLDLQEIVRDYSKEILKEYSRKILEEQNIQKKNIEDKNNIVEVNIPFCSIKVKNKNNAIEVNSASNEIKNINNQDFFFSQVKNQEKNIINISFKNHKELKHFSSVEHQNKTISSITFTDKKHISQVINLHESVTSLYINGKKFQHYNNFSINKIIENLLNINITEFYDEITIIFINNIYGLTDKELEHLKDVLLQIKNLKKIIVNLKDKEQEKKIKIFLEQFNIKVE